MPDNVFILFEETAIENQFPNLVAVFPDLESALAEGGKRNDLWEIEQRRVNGDKDFVNCWIKRPNGQVLKWNEDDA